LPDPTPYRLLVLDIDGTLVAGDKVVPPGVVRAITAAQARGVRVCLATGRRPESTRRFVDTVGADPPTIAYNGGLIYDFPAGRALWSRPLPLGTARRVLPVLRRFPETSPLVYIFNKVFAERRTPFVDLYAGRDRLAVDSAPDFARLLTAPPMKFLIVGHRPDLERLSRALADLPGPPINQVFSQQDYLEILPPGVSKGVALREMCRIVRIPVARAVAVGDAMNDLTMVQTAGLGVAVEGSPPELLEAAGMTCPPPEQEGVRVLIERLFLTRDRAGAGGPARIGLRKGGVGVAKAAAGVGKAAAARAGRWTIPPQGGHMDKRTGVYLQNMTGHEVDERMKKNDILLVPLGATEAHGAHAPLGEDVFLVCRMAEEVAARTGCTVAQPVWYGSHPYHHLGMPGTVVIPEEIFTGYVRAMIAGFWNMGFRKQILLNGHGQEYVIPTAMHQFAKRYRVPSLLLLVNWYHPIRDHFKLTSEGGTYETPFIHADEVETSWSLALFPELLDMKYAPDNKVIGFLPGDHVDKAGNLLNRPINWYSQVGAGPIEVKAYIEGVVGRSSIARAEKAVGGVPQLLDYLERLVTDVHKAFPPGKLPPVGMVTERDPKELQAVLKGPRKGGKSIYSLGYPP